MNINRMNIPFIKRLDHDMQEVVQGASSALAIRVFGTLLGFAVSLMVAHLLGAEGAGLYFLTLSSILIAATLGRVGLDNTVVRFVAGHAAGGEQRAVQDVRNLAFGIAGAGSLVMAIGMFFGASFLGGSVYEKPELSVPFMLGAIAVVPTSLLMIQADALRGIKSIASSQWIKTVLISLGCLILLYPFASTWGVNGAVAAYTFSALITSVIAIYLWGKATSTSEKNAKGTDHSVRTLLSSSWPLYGVALSGMVIQQTPTVFLGVWSTSAEVGVFVVASRIANLLLFPLMAMISILAPKFAMMAHEGDMMGLARLARQSSMLLTIISLPSAILVYLGSKWILGWFGRDFIQGSPVLGILLFGVVINAASGAVAEVLMMSGHGKEARRSNMIGAILITVLGVVLIPMFHTIGAAVSVAAAIAIKNLLMVALVKTKLSFYPIGFVKPVESSNG